MKTKQQRTERKKRVTRDPWDQVIWFHDIPVLREKDEQQQFDPSEW